MDSKDGTGLSRTLASTETLRLVELQSLDAFYTPLEERFERLTRVGRSSLGTRVVAVTVLDKNRLWFKSVNGWKINELPLEGSLCFSTVEKGELTVIPDTLEDPRFAQHPLVTQPPRFRFYAGIPLRDYHGQVVGTFCAMDTQPRNFDSEQLRCLGDLASLAERELFTKELWDGYGEIVSKLGAARREAMFDPLTRLWNRRGGLAMLGVALKQLQSGVSPVVVCVADIDNFKRVNDLYGHQAGDQVLRKVAQTMVASLRPRDTVCRLGGDEFLIVLLDATEVQLREVATRLKAAIAAHPVQCRSGPISVSLSLGGVAYAQGAVVSVETALEESDVALYESKRGGRNRLSMSGVGVALGG
jgi:diguanylate cyclase (GGDEF)-like protein